MNDMESVLYVARVSVSLALLLLLPVAITYGTIICFERSGTMFTTSMNTVRSTVQKRVPDVEELLGRLYKSLVHRWPDSLKFKRHRNRWKAKRSGWRKCKRRKAKQRIKRKNRSRKVSRDQTCSPIQKQPRKRDKRAVVKGDQGASCDKQNAPDIVHLSQPPLVNTDPVSHKARKRRHQKHHKRPNRKSEHVPHGHVYTAIKSSGILQLSQHSEQNHSYPVNLNELKQNSSKYEYVQVTEYQNMITNNDVSHTHLPTQCHNDSCESEQCLLVLPRSHNLYYELMVLPVTDTDGTLDQTHICYNSWKCCVLTALNDEMPTPLWEITCKSHCSDII